MRDVGGEPILGLLRVHPFMGQMIDSTGLSTTPWSHEIRSTSEDQVLVFFIFKQKSEESFATEVVL